MKVYIRRMSGVFHAYELNTGKVIDCILLHVDRLDFEQSYEPGWEITSSAKKPFSQDVSSPSRDEASRLFASCPSRSPGPSLPFISCVGCARMPHLPSKVFNALLVIAPPPSTFLLYLPPYLLVYRPPADSYQLRASGGPPRSPLTSSDLDLSAPVS